MGGEPGVFNCKTIGNGYNCIESISRKQGATGDHSAPGVPSKGQEGGLGGLHWYYYVQENNSFPIMYGAGGSRSSKILKKWSGNKIPRKVTEKINPGHLDSRAGTGNNGKDGKLKK